MWNRTLPENLWYIWGRVFDTQEMYERTVSLFNLGCGYVVNKRAEHVKIKPPVWPGLLPDGISNGTKLSVEEAERFIEERKQGVKAEGFIKGSQ